MKSIPALTVAIVIAQGCGAPPGRGVEEGGSSDGVDDGDLVGVVSLERILRETERGRRAASTLQEEGDALQAQLTEYRERLEEQASGIQEAQSRGVPEARVQRLVGEYQALAGEAQQAQAALQNQLQQRQEALTAPILEAVRRVAARIGERDGYALILDQSGVPFAEPTTDLTDFVIAELEEESARDAIDAELEESSGVPDGAEGPTPEPAGAPAEGQPSP